MMRVSVRPWPPSASRSFGHLRPGPGSWAGSAASSGCPSGKIQCWRRECRSAASSPGGRPAGRGGPGRRSAPGGGDLAARCPLVRAGHLANGEAAGVVPGGGEMGSASGGACGDLRGRGPGAPVATYDVALGRHAPATIASTPVNSCRRPRRRRTSGTVASASISEDVVAPSPAARSSTRRRPRWIRRVRGLPPANSTGRSDEPAGPGRRTEFPFPRCGGRVASDHEPVGAVGRIAGRKHRHRVVASRPSRLAPSTGVASRRAGEKAG